MYVMHHHTQRCACGTTESWSHIYIAETVGDPSRLKACNAAIPPDAAIEIVHLPGKPVSICTACIPSDASIRGTAARARFEEARRRKAHEAAYGHIPAAAKQPQRPSTIDDLA